MYLNTQYHIIQLELIGTCSEHHRLAYFKAAFQLFEADYYVKADDDIYLRPGILPLSQVSNQQCNTYSDLVILMCKIMSDRLATLLAKERTHALTYIGCMKKGHVITNPKIKW